MDSSIKLAADVKLDEPQIAGQPGTLLQHGLETRDGKLVRVWKPGLILKPDGTSTGYAVGRRGELRHATPQFKGSKKNRKRWLKKLQAARYTAVPVGYVELTFEEKLKPLDLLIDVETGKWFVTPIVKPTVGEVASAYPRFPRAARKLEVKAA